MPEIATPIEIPPEFPLCVCVPLPQEEICLELPFGVEICSNTKFKHLSLGDMLLELNGNLQPFMAALMPLLILISLVKALIDCMNSVADAVSQLSPDPIFDCLDRLAELLPQLLQFVPPFNYIALINNIILFLITLLEAIIDLMEELLSLNIDLEISLLPDDDKMRCCLDANLRARLEQLAAIMRATGPIFTLLCQVLTILEIPPTRPLIKPLKDAIGIFEDFTSADLTEDAVASLRSLQDLLRDISNALQALGASRLAQIIQKANACECD